MANISRNDDMSSSNSYEMQEEHNRIITSDNEDQGEILMSSADSLKTEDHKELYDHRGQTYSVMKSKESKESVELLPTGKAQNKLSPETSGHQIAKDDKRIARVNSNTQQHHHKHFTESVKLQAPHTKLTVSSSSHDVMAHMQRRKSVGSSVNSTKLQKSKSNTTAGSISSKTKIAHTTTNVNRARRNSMDSDDSNDTQETEEDVCFPMIEYQHDRINGIDFDDLEEFARDEIQFNMLQQQLQQTNQLNSTGSNLYNTSSSSVSKAALRYTPSMKSTGHKFSSTPLGNNTTAPTKAPTSASAVIAGYSKHEPLQHKSQVKNKLQHSNSKGISFGFNKVESEDGDSSMSTTGSYHAVPHNPQQLPEYTKSSTQQQQQQQQQQQAGYQNSEFEYVDDSQTLDIPQTQPFFESMYQAPDRFSFFCSNSDETVHAPSISSLLQKSGSESFKELFQNGEPTWWLDCVCPTDEEMKCISKCFGIHPLTAEDIRMQESREKVELFKSYYFVCFHTFENDMESEDFLEPINVYIVVFGNGILTFHFGPEVIHSANVRRRVRQLRDYVDVTSDWICYALIDDITDSFAPVITSIEFEADVIEDSVFMARDLNFAEMLQRIGESRRKTMTLMRLLSGKADVIKMFAKRCQDETKGIGPALTSQVNIANLTAHNQQGNAQPRADIALYLGDIQDHVLTMYQNLLSCEKIFGRSHANYLAQLQVESFNSNNKVTEMLSRVTMLGTILVPLNLITGLFGMNVRVPGYEQKTLGWFFGIVGILVLVMIFALWFSAYWLNRITNPETLNDASAGGKSVMNTFINRDNYNKSMRNQSRDGQDGGISDIQSRLPPLPRSYSNNKKPGYAKSLNSLPSKYGRYD